MDLLFLSRLAGVDLRTSESFDCDQCFGHGPFQKRMLLIILLGTFMGHGQTLLVPLVTGDVDHWCKPPVGLNISTDEWKHIAIPMEADGRFSRCHVYERCKPPAERYTLVNRQDVDALTPTAGSWHNQCFVDQAQDNNDTRDVPCDAWDYDVQTAESSAVSTWNMVCERRLMRFVLVSMQSFGSVVGLFLVGSFEDYIGPKTVLQCSAVLMLICMICTFMATRYLFYATACFLAGCSVAVNAVATFVVPFDTMTHAQRPQQVLTVAIISLALWEIWNIVVKLVNTNWRLKQVIFLAPAALLFPALWFARESPRWLVAKGRLDEAEAVMMRAAAINNFPLPATASMVQKLKEQLKNNAGREGGDRGDLIDARSLRRRALAMFVIIFSISIVLYIDAVHVVQYKDFWIPAFTVVIMLVVGVMMHHLITGVSLVTVLSVCFVMIGCMQSSLSIAATLRLRMLTKAFLVLCKGVSNVLVIHCLTYCMELFPSALRSGVLCYAFGFCRVASVCALLTLRLLPTGYEHLVFATTALFPFASLLMIRNLPKTTVVEDAKITAREPTDSVRLNMDHMRRTLEGNTMRKRSSAPSTDNTRSSQRRRPKRTGDSSSGAPKAYPRSNATEAPE
ncbi:solute carrier family 22 member 7-like [Rhipicephalus microplus]|uniref:solute carrier family 22 member 7-like n=1 Tax=Rhipicephalus microplus TaxID=6941 RepID=UPI003F6B8513